MPEVLREHRTALGLSQAELAEQVGVDKRQIRRYEAGESQPALNVSRMIAKVLGITIDQLAGEESHRPDLSGEWWACWQSWQDGRETVNPQRIALRPLRGGTFQVQTITRGTAPDDGGYTWEGELRLFDDEALIGWYAANEEAVRSKGSMFFALHTHGRRAVGRWVGKSHDGSVMSGVAAMARTEDDVMALIDEQRHAEAPA